MTASKPQKGEDSFTGKELKQLGERLRYLRKLRGYSNYEVFANKHNLGRVQVGRYESGKDLRFSTLVKVLQALDITLAEFFSEGFD